MLEYFFSLAKLSGPFAYGRGVVRPLRPPLVWCLIAIDLHGDWDDEILVES